MPKQKLHINWAAIDKLVGFSVMAIIHDAIFYCPVIYQWLIQLPPEQRIIKREN